MIEKIKAISYVEAIKKSKCSNKEFKLFYSEEEFNQKNNSPCIFKIKSGGGDEMPIITENIVVQGDKKWKTMYVAVIGSETSADIVKDSRSHTKKDCVIRAREYTMATGIPTFVLIGKTPVGFSRVQSRIHKQNKYLLKW